MATMKIKVGDTVKVIAGKDNKKEGEVLAVDHKKGKVIVKGVNIITKHNKGMNAQDPNAGIIKREAPIDASNVMVVVNGKPSRVGFQVEKTEDGKRKVHRIAKVDGTMID